ncbi:MAG: ATP-binding protein, partial [Methylococcaceae bacterium]
MPDGHEIIRPYPGLRPFESWEGEIFFGREEHTNRLLDILKERHFLAVIGPSGSGKSSLVRAGLLPALPLGSLGTGSDWRIALMRPGNRPMQSLTHALLARSTLGIELVGEERIPQDESDMTPDVALIEADLRRGPLGLIDIVQDARTRQTGKEAFNLLVLVDQFEELFTYADAGGRKADEAEAFVNLLLAPPTVPDAGIYIVLTMRTDFLGNCVRFLELPDAINRAQYLTPRLTREQIERAITSPAYLFDGDVEPTLVTELINSVSNDPDQLPILQHALSRMWDEASQHQNEIPCIAWNDFNAVGGITNALSRHADEILASLSPRNRIEQPLCPGQQAAVDLFRAITEQRSAEAGGQAVRRPQSLVRIAQWSGRNWQDFEPVIDAYAREGVNFLHINSTLNSDTIVDISHEALIRQWQRLRNWVTQEARLAGEYKRFRGLGEDFKSGSGALLTGAALERALEWQNGTILKGPNNDAWRPTANWADRYRKNEDVPANTEFNEVLKFIEDSHAVKLKAKRRARIINWALITLTGLSLIGMFSAVGFAYQSRKNQIATEAALLWTPLDFSLPIINVSEKQSSGLLKLEAADDDRKGVFLDQLLRDQALAEHFINNPEVIMTALAGISPTRRDNILHRLDEEPRQDSDIFRLARFLILSELDAQISSDDIMSAITIKDNKDIVSRKKLGQRIKTLIGKMAEADLEALFKRILATFNDSKTVYEFEPRAEALTAIIDRISQEKLDKFAEYLIADIKTVNNPLQLDILKQSLAHVAAKMQDEQLAGVLANQLFVAIKASLDTGLINAKRTSLVAGQIEAFGKGVEILAPKISATVVEELVEQLVILVVDSKNSYAFKTLGQNLVTVAAKMPENQPQTAILADHLFTA